MGYLNMNNDQALNLANAVFNHLGVIKKKNNSFDPWQILLTIVFWLMAVQSRRHFPLFFIASLPLIVNILSNYLNLKPATSNSNKTFGFIAGLLVTSILLLVGISTIRQINFINNPFGNYLNLFLILG